MIYCPPIKEYSQSFNNSLADEVEALPPSATHIPEAIGDYVYLRDRIRRCEEQAKQYE